MVGTIFIEVVKTQTSVGVVCLRYVNNHLEVLLINNSDVFGFPYGGQQIGETLEQTALRQVNEKVGVQPIAISIHPVKTNSYNIRQGFKRTLQTDHYYACIISQDNDIQLFEGAEKFIWSHPIGGLKYIKFNNIRLVLLSSLKWVEENEPYLKLLVSNLLKLR